MLIRCRACQQDNLVTVDEIVFDWSEIDKCLFCGESLEAELTEALGLEETEAQSTTPL